MQIKHCCFLALLVLPAHDSNANHSGAHGRAEDRALTRNQAAQAHPARAAACTGAEYRQFDFWVGDWDAFEGEGRAPAARVTVTRILDDCAVLEDYREPNGHHGQSCSIYDSYRKVWHQTWVTNDGQLLVLEGKFENGEMVLTGADPSKGAKGMVRGVWKPVAGGTREIGTTSRDGGQTWQPWFDLVFRPHVK